jgi:outer membrane lipoprotein-sorting protein
MKYLLLLGIIMAAMILAQTAQAQTVEEIVEKHIAARGGLAKLNALQSIYMEGSREMMGNEVTVKVTKEQGKLSRTEFEMGAGNGFMLVTDKEGWSMFSMRSTTPNKLPDEAVKNQQIELDIAGPLVNYAAKGHKAELIGKDAPNGVDCYKIKLTTTTGRAIFYWIDASTYILLQSSQINKGRDGADMEVFTFFKDYKAVDGIQFAHTIATKSSGGGMTEGSTTFDKIELNKAVDPKLYKPE